MLGKEKGSITIYLAIIFAALVIFLGLFIDLARIKIAQNQLRRIANASARSVVANYNTGLKNQYGLFAVNKSDYNRDFRRYLQANLAATAGSGFFSYRLESSTFNANKQLADSLKGQILEEMKYKAPVIITREIVNKFRQVEDISSNYNRQKDKGKAELSRKKQPTPGSKGGGTTSGTKADAAPGTDKDASPATAATEAARKSLLAQLKAYRGKSPLKVEDVVGAGNLFNPSQFDPARADANSNQVKGIFDLVTSPDSLLKLRDQLFINEYILARFPNLSVGREKVMDAEYVICGGKPGTNLKAAIVTRLFPLRMALDTMAYLAFSQAPPELLSRLIYSLTMGALQGALDTYQLLEGRQVTIAAMQPGNPLDKIQSLQLGYQDHLRLLLLLGGVSEAEKLDRITRLVNYRAGIDPASSGTVLGGQVGISFRLWFLPMGGLGNLDNGPFGTRVQKGRCYITKAVEFGY
ncbi:MAG TPA: Tad domain-containing protein [Bacillota bacterium]|nr:Tad domain-containing protein [Bacillota bacterium]